VLSINRLTIRLPAEHGGSAESIGRLVADRLADVQPSGSARLGRVVVPPVAASTPEQVARHAADAVGSAIDRGGTC
jgi:hypothetical protein